MPTSKDPTLDLLELLDELGYLEGTQWLDSRDSENRVQVIVRRGKMVTYGRPGNVNTLPVRDFLQWFHLESPHLKVTTPSVTRGGDTVRGVTLSRS